MLAVGEYAVVTEDLVPWSVRAGDVGVVSRCDVSANGRYLVRFSTFDGRSPFELSVHQSNVRPVSDRDRLCVRDRQA